MKLARVASRITAVVLALSVVASCGAGTESSSQSKTRTKNGALIQNQIIDQNNNIAGNFPNSNIVNSPNNILNNPVPVSTGKVGALSLPIVTTVDGCDFAFKNYTFYPCAPIKQMYGYFLLADGTSSDVPALTADKGPYKTFVITPPVNATGLSFKVELLETGAFLKAGISLVDPSSSQAVQSNSNNITNVPPITALVPTTITPTTSMVVANSNILPTPISMGRVDKNGYPVVASINGCDVSYKDFTYYPCGPISQESGYFVMGDTTNDVVEYSGYPKSTTPYTSFKIVPTEKVVRLVMSFYRVNDTQYYKTMINLKVQSVVSSTTIASTTTTMARTTSTIASTPTTMPPVATSVPYAQRPTTQCMVAYDPNTSRLSVCLPTYSLTYQLASNSSTASPVTVEQSGGTNVFTIQNPTKKAIVSLKGKIIDGSSFAINNLQISNPPKFYPAVLTGVPAVNISGANSSKGIASSVTKYPLCHLAINPATLKACKSIRRLTYRYSNVNEDYLTPWEIVESNALQVGIQKPISGATHIIFHILFQDGSWIEPVVSPLWATPDVNVKDWPGQPAVVMITSCIAGYKLTNNQCSPAPTTTSTTTTTTTTAPSGCRVYVKADTLFWCKQAKVVSVAYIVNGVLTASKVTTYASTDSALNQRFQKPDGATALYVKFSFADGTFAGPVKVSVGGAPEYVTPK